MAPLVSCVLPTRNRAGFISLAIQSYLSQSYPHKELVILDNGNDGTETVIPADASIRYHRIGGVHPTGDMRNLVNEMTRGDLICHFDSDDWSAPGRLEQQVARLGPHGQLTGYSTMLFYDVRNGATYLWQLAGQKFIVGASMCYRKSWWVGHRFRRVPIAEDVRFFNLANRLVPRGVTASRGTGMMVALIHDHQTSVKDTEGVRYERTSLAALPKAFSRLRTRFPV